MLKNLFIAIHHYDNQFFNDMKKIRDPRHQSYITYPLEVICITRILAYCCHIQSMAELNDDFNNDTVIGNVSKICGIELDNLPHGDTINALFKRLDVGELRDFLTSIVKTMIQRRFFDRYRFCDRYYQLIIDGTQLYSFDKDHIEKSLTRTYEDGSKTYHTQSLTAYLMIGESLMIPIDFEMIENEKENASKQDCELNAGKRLLKRIKKNYPRLQIVLSGDALYACTEIIEICKSYHWKYIIRLKEGSIPTLVEEFEEMKENKYTETQYSKIMKDGEIIKETYYWYTNDIQYGENLVNIVKIEEIIKEESKIFIFMTNIEITTNNVENVAKTGRKRWKIENKGFNDEKNHGYGLTHAYSYNENAVKCHYIFLLISHLFMQLLEHYLKTKKRAEKIMTIGKEIKEALRFAHLNAQDFVEILTPIQVRQEVPY